MTIGNYGQLRAAIADWLADSTLGARIPGFVALAEDRIAQDLRVRAMEAEAELAISAGRADLPDRFAGLRRVALAGDAARPLAWRSPQAFHRQGLGQAAGVPAAYAVEGDRLLFGPAPAGEARARLYYWRRFAPLAADEDDNWILRHARGLLLYAALFEAAAYLQDEPRALAFAAQYEDLLARTRKADRAARYPAGGIAPRPGAVGP